MKKILTLVCILFLLKTGAQTSVHPVSCGARNLYVRVIFSDEFFPVRTISTTTCPGGVYDNTLEEFYVKCRMELFDDAACTQPVFVNHRFFSFVRDVAGSDGTRTNPAVIYNYNCNPIVSPRSEYGDNWRIDRSVVYVTECNWDCNTGNYNCVTSGPGAPLNYNIVINCCFAPSILSVEPVNLRGLRHAGMNTLDWTLDRTRDFDLLELERSLDGTNYSVLYSSANFSLSSYTDPAAVTAYYRLRVFGRYGSSFLSNTVLLQAGTVVPFVVSPSPFKDRVTVSISSLSRAGAVFRLVAADGKVVFEESTLLNPGLNTFSFQLPVLAKGVYVMVMMSEGRIERQKVLRG